MRTQVLPVDAASIRRAASLLARGEVVAFPTETVYGLGANAQSEDAVRKIYAAKERPADNPLIVHIASLDALTPLVSETPKHVPPLAALFWPGPLTMVMPASGVVPGIASAGLSTVAVRIPAHPAALALIRAAGLPISAPSANRSGRPSPTTAAHVLEDMDGRIPLILDGGPCGVGVESTVLDLSGDVPTILRPGGVTLEMLRAVLPDVRIDPAVLRPLAEGAAARSPGMRHRHYAPRARVVVVRGAPERVVARAAALYDGAAADENPAVLLCATAHAGRYGARTVYPLGDTQADMASRLFDALRAMDAMGARLVIAEATGTDGIGLALMNRLLRAADFSVIDA